ncbi:MAG: rRNA pseudouridine synthase [Candidatus Obscuribacterales bacterium]|nr:rRNA pseudouridine synthase [Steroidobacteraceae bacterium]
MSKLGLCSRTQAALWVQDGRVKVNGRVVQDAEFPVRQDTDRIEIDDRPAAAVERVVLMLNKPRGLITTTKDEQARDTVYSCLAEANLPWLAPIGRLDKASEGLLLFTNDPVWAALITDPKSMLKKTYQVQIDCVPNAELLADLERGAVIDDELSSASSARILRVGDKNAWLEIVLNEGKNRQIRRLLTAFDISVLRLIRVAVGSLILGELKKGEWRLLTQGEIELL